MKKLFLTSLLLTVAFSFTGCSPQDMQGMQGMQGQADAHAHDVMAKEGK